MYSEWIKNGTKKPGKSRAGLAKAITQALKLNPPMSRTTIYKIIAGTREIRASELEPASRYMEEPIPLISDLIVQSEQATVDIVGSVCVGSWIDSGIITENAGSIVVPRDHAFPNAKHLAYVVKDDSMDAIKIFEGDIIVCVAFKDTRLKLANGMNVVIERKNAAGLVERSLKAVEIDGNTGNPGNTGNSVEFKSLCTSKQYKSVLLNKAKASGEKITVVGLLRRSTRDY